MEFNINDGLLELKAKKALMYKQRQCMFFEAFNTNAEVVVVAMHPFTGKPMQYAINSLDEMEIYRDMLSKLTALNLKKSVEQQVDIDEMVRCQQQVDDQITKNKLL